VHLPYVEAIAISDAELGTLACAGDVQALAGLLERCRPSLYAAAVGLLGNRADAADAVQDTFVIALLRLGGLRQAGAARAWLHTVLRNVCLMRIRQRREVPVADTVLANTVLANTVLANTVLPGTAAVPGPEEALDRHVMREWVWQALGTLSADEQLAVMLRHFTRCTSYTEIARVTAVPVGTVRSRLNRARARLAGTLLAAADGTPLSHARAEAGVRQQWTEFYREVHDRPVPRTYRELFAPDVEVRDPAGQWHGIGAWSAEERAAISAGVRATIIDVVASRDITIIEVDFRNPAEWPDHCPPHATFVHRLAHGRSRQLRIHYPAGA
jgi:RNA polymerase sigma-70 factor (ECF subfamily)